MKDRWLAAMELHSEAIDKAKEHLKLNNKIEDIINFIKNSKSLFFTGVGKNKDLMYKISKTYNSISIKSNFIDPVDAVHGDMGMVPDGSSIIASSKSGTTSELINFLKRIKENRSDIKIMMIHCNENLNIDLIDYNIFIPVNNEADHLNMIPTVSLCVIETIMHSVACHIIQDLGFSKQDLYKNHPGGNIGEICKTKILT